MHSLIHSFLSIFFCMQPFLPVLLLNSIFSTERKFQFLLQVDISFRGPGSTVSVLSRTMSNTSCDLLILVSSVISWSSLCFESLFHFFGTYAPISILRIHLKLKKRLFPVISQAKWGRVLAEQMERKKHKGTNISLSKYHSVDEKNCYFKLCLI